eukprot:CAMPEP_0177615286 /NCGR_PEP_ID=MMETSP0419_2-20121207/23333_1 /TAXON_ID=582737 /ORGANISM="Tetraselmis sp., Strain GSL018" /LENGTH=196 /DNA_ID=CAMNT_0019112851 /DNA_START=213 /DNA_END=804 /DNA_ORIENTATION=-
MPPSQGHHVEDSGTLLGQSMGTSASALPSLDGSANVTAAEARAHARSRAALPALAVIRPRRTVEADLVTVPETAAVGVVVVEPRPCSRQPLLLTGRTPTLRRRCPRPPEHEHVGPSLSGVIRGASSVFAFPAVRPFRLPAHWHSGFGHASTPAAARARAYLCCRGIPVCEFLLDVVGQLAFGHFCPTKRTGKKVFS